jgi:hypothetical protein
MKHLKNVCRNSEPNPGVDNDLKESHGFEFTQVRKVSHAQVCLSERDTEVLK